MAPKEADNITQKSGLIYRYRCDRLEHDQEYIGKLAGTFAERLKEHLRASFPINDYAKTSGHHNKLSNFSIEGRESHSIANTIKVAMFIMV